MDKPGNGHIDYELLGKYISGNATDDEQQRVAAWLSESEENRQEFEAVKAIWQNTPEQESTEQQVNVDAAWDKLQTRIHESDSKQSSSGQTIDFRTILFRAAAVLVIAAGIWGAFYLIRKTGGPGMKMVASRDQIKEVMLPDSSVVTLNKNSFISFPSRFEDSIRLVRLSGEGYFSVAKNDAQPFIVESGEARIKVVGTEFNVLAFDDSQEVAVNVIEGEVLLYKEDNEGYLADSVQLTKGEQGVFYKKTRKLAESAIDPAAIYWKSKTLIFERTELKKVFEVLTGLFDVKIDPGSQEIKKCRLTATFRNEEIDNIISVITTTFDLEMEKTDNTFKISGEGCQ